jgi:hypothetical protein
MIKELLQYIQNKNLPVERMTNEKILGNNTKHTAFAKFWENHGQDIELVTAVKLHEFEMSGAFNSDELSAYIKGITDIGKFFLDCWLEKEAKLNKTPQENTIS